jgi:hypothetical protein
MARNIGGGLARRFDGIQEVEKGRVMDRTYDPELQALSAEASRELAVPIAAVVVVHEDYTFARAHHGLSDDGRFTPRDQSFCQYVVRDGVYLEINDARNDERVPRETAEKFGVSSYLGAPLVLNGKTIGSMCVVDTEPRLFDDRERGILHRIAAQASRRLALLATQPRDLERELHDRAVRPAFSEIRNRLQPMLGNVAAMHSMLAELIVARMQNTPDANAKMDLVIRELATCLDEMTTDTAILHRGILAIERASLTSDADCSLQDIIGPATTLAHHRTKLVQGVTWSGECRELLAVPRVVAINALAAALAGIAESIPREAMRGITGTITLDQDVAVIELRADVAVSAIDELASQLSLLVGDDSHVRVRNAALQIAFATSRLS